MSIRNSVSLLVGAAAAGVGGVYGLQGTKQTYQAWIASDLGSEAAVVAIQVTNDPRALSDPTNAAWMTLGTITIGGSDGASDGFNSDAPWQFVRANATTVTACTVSCSIVDQG